MLTADGSEIWEFNRFISVAARFAELADCTILSIRFAKLLGIFFTLDS